MNRTISLWCAHSGLVFAVVLGIGAFGITGWLPPVDPSRDATAILAMFQEDRMSIRVGISVTALGAVLFWTFAAAISMQMKRIEGEHHPLSYIQMACASGGIMALLIPSYFWLALAYRPETMSPQTIQLINDFAWISFIGMYPPGFLQNICIGICILSDRRAEPIFPRWLAYANFWIALGFLFAALLPFFQDGPFAWNGIVGFWVLATEFFGWIILMWWFVVRAIRRQETWSVEGPG
jgi:hypothetical protein